MSVSTIDEVEKIKLALHEYNLGIITVVYDKESATNILEQNDEDRNGGYMIIGDQATSTWLPDEE